MLIKRKYTLGGMLALILLFGVIASTFAEINTTPPSTKLKWGSYTNWIQSVLDEQPNSRQGLGNNNVVKQANSLATKKGKNAIFITDKTNTIPGRIGIGIQTPQELVDIRGEKASIKVLSPSSVAKVIVGNGGLGIGAQGVFQLFNATNTVALYEDYINSSNNITVRGKNVVLSSQQCPNGQKVKGTNTEGVILCAEDGGERALPFCTLNDFALSASKGPLDYCILGS